MDKAQRLISEVRRGRRKQQLSTAAEASEIAALKKHNHYQHQRQMQQQQQKTLGDSARREPLRPNLNSQRQSSRRLLIAKKPSEACHHHHHRHQHHQKAIDDAKDGEAEEEAAGTRQKARRPCLSRAAELPAGMPDVDLADHCTMVSAYAKEIFVYLAECELQYVLPEDFLTGQAEVTERSRAVLVDWMLQLSSQLELQADTYHLSVRLLDHYLAIDRGVGKRQLQLLGAAALWLASKLEEVYCVSISDLLHVCCGVFSRRDLLSTEVKLVGALDFRLLPPVPITFLRRLSKVAGVDNQLHFVAKYMLELATLCSRLASRPASQLAAAAMRVALWSSGRDWSDLLAFYSGYSLADLSSTVGDLARACIRVASAAGSKQQRFVYQKYASSNCFSVAGWPELQPDSEFLAGLMADDANSL